VRRRGDSGRAASYSETIPPDLRRIWRKQSRFQGRNIYRGWFLDISRTTSRIATNPALAARTAGYYAALAEKTGKSESLIYSRLALLHLMPVVAEACRAQRITASHANLIAADGRASLAGQSIRVSIERLRDGLLR
jgi:hypothetical protein